MRAQSLTPAYELGVIEIADAVAKGSITPTEILRNFLDRIAQVEDRVRAWSFLDAEGAAQQAATLTVEARSGTLRGPLHGVPVGIKDEFHIQGQPTGARGTKAPPEPQDATPVARLRAAGAIILGRTCMPVGGIAPPTRNPWNLEHTPGGSSSGSAAAVGARMVPVALGEQTGGSNLRPAAYCGVCGLKPTYGRVSRAGCYPFTWSLDHPGIIARSMADVALVLSVIAGSDPRDPTTLAEPAPPARLDVFALPPPRIGVVRNFYPERTEPVMQNAIELGITKLTEAGASVRDVLLPPEFALTWPAYTLIVMSEGATISAQQAEAPWDPSAGSPGVNRALGSLVPTPYYLQALRIRGWVSRKVADLFHDLDAILMPVAPGPAPKGLSWTGDPSLQVPWSLLGYPAISINAGLSPEGLPLGIQLVAPPKEDYHLLQIGTWCQQVLGVPVPPLA